MDMKEAMAQRLASKEAFDEALIKADAGNIRNIGAPEVRDPETRRVIAPRKVYSLDIGDYLSGGSRVRVPADFEYVIAPGLPGVNGDRMSDGLHHTRWWLVREFLRYATGQYELTSALRGIALYFPHLAPHVKAGDPDPLAVYYTPDAAAGERDVQVQTTIGRLVRKLYPHASDEEVRDVEANHRSEILGDIEFVTGNVLVHCYERETPASWSNCMGKSRGVWGSALCGRHPVEAYDAPGFALAVLRRGDGTVTARCLTWTNPNDENDKRFVRVYGDMSLDKRLRRKGFRPAGLAGARLRKITLGSSELTETVVMPYLDRVGGKADGELEALNVVLDGEWLYVVGGDELSTYFDAGFNPAGAQTTSGKVVVSKSCTRDAIMFTCPFTGRRMDRRLDDVDVLFTPGEPLARTSKEIAEEMEKGGEWKRVRYYSPDRQVFTDVLARADIPTFTHNDVVYVEGDGERSALGYIRLSSRYYTNTDWTFTGPKWKSVQAPGSDEWFTVLAEDVVDAIVPTPGGVRSFACHKSEVADRRTWTKVHPSSWTKAHPSLNGRPTYAHKDVTVFKTASGRKVVPCIHDVVKLFDGSYEFLRNTTTFYIFGEVFRRHTKGTPSPEAIAAAVAPKLLKKASQTLELCASDVAPRELRERKQAYWLQSIIKDAWGGVPAIDNDTDSVTLITVSGWRSDESEARAVENMRNLRATIDRAVANNIYMQLSHTLESKVYDLLLKSTIPTILGMIFGEDRGDVRVLNAGDERFFVAA